MQKVKMDEILKKRYNWAYYARGTPFFFFFFGGGGGGGWGGGGVGGGGGGGEGN